MADVGADSKQEIKPMEQKPKSDVMAERAVERGQEESDTHKETVQMEMQRGEDNPAQSSQQQKKDPMRGTVSSNGGAMSSVGGGGRRVQNIVIDIESDDLTYNQARSIRLQIQRDVEQLRNRVRMLQQEEVRAMKKIQETRKRTQHIQTLQQKNDATYLKKLQDENRRKQIQEKEKKLQQDRKMRSLKEVRIRGNEVTQNRIATVIEVRQQKHNIKHALTTQKEQSAYQMKEKSRQIVEARRAGINKQNEYIKNKVSAARAEVNKDAEKMKSQINNYETEAQELERLEAELLLKLQETQKQERDAFGRLECAMVDASIPKHLRRVPQQKQFQRQDSNQSGSQVGSVSQSHMARAKAGKSREGR